MMDIFSWFSIGISHAWIDSILIMLVKYFKFQSEVITWYKGSGKWTPPALKHMAEDVTTTRQWNVNASQWWEDSAVLL